jgi:hypothetical protein
MSMVTFAISVAQMDQGDVAGVPLAFLTDREGQGDPENVTAVPSVALAATGTHWSQGKYQQCPQQMVTEAIPVKHSTASAMSFEAGRNQQTDGHLVISVML